MLTQMILWTWRTVMDKEIYVLGSPCCSKLRLTWIDEVGHTRERPGVLYRGHECMCGDIPRRRFLGLEQDRSVQIACSNFPRLLVEQDEAGRLLLMDPPNIRLLNWMLWTHVISS